MQLKDRLKTARLKAGLTQTAAAARVDMSQANYHKLESGKNQGSTKMLELALLFGVSPEWLATGAGEMVPVNDTGPDEGADTVPATNDEGADTGTDGAGETIQLDAQKWAVLSLAVDRLMSDIKHNTYNDTPETLETMEAAAVEVKQLLNVCKDRNGYTFAGGGAKQ